MLKIINKLLSQGFQSGMLMRELLSSLHTNQLLEFIYDLKHKYRYPIFKILTKIIKKDESDNLAIDQGLIEDLLKLAKSSADDCHQTCIFLLDKDFPMSLIGELIEKCFIYGYRRTIKLILQDLVTNLIEYLEKGTQEYLERRGKTIEVIFDIIFVPFDIKVPGKQSSRSL